MYGIFSNIFTRNLLIICPSVKKKFKMPVCDKVRAKKCSRTFFSGRLCVWRYQMDVRQLQRLVQSSSVEFGSGGEVCYPRLTFVAGGASSADGGAVQ